MAAPVVISASAHAAFQAQARAMRLRPEHRWIGDYVAYEWEHLRHMIDALPCALVGRKVLEFGCNVGASAIVFACSGAQVSACDIARDWIELARLNAARHGVDDIDFLWTPDTRHLPYQDACFDLIACNSVLEYIDVEPLPAVQHELARVLRPGGMLLVTGTSNRLWPCEVHSRTWGMNWLPRRFAPRAPRGVWPWTVRYGFGDGWRNLDNGPEFARTRHAMGKPAWQIAAIRWVAAALHTSPGLLTPNLSCVLRKPLLP